VTVTNQSFSVRKGQDIVIAVTIPGTDNLNAYTWEATFRGKQSNALALTVPHAAITVTGRVVSVPVTDVQTDLWTERAGYLFSLWRVDDGSENPYAEGVVTMIRNSRSG